MTSNGKGAKSADSGFRMCFRLPTERPMSLEALGVELQPAPRILSPSASFGLRATWQAGSYSGDER